MNTIYQLQLETSDKIYFFEIATDKFDAIEWAEAYLASELEEYGPFHVGGHSSIGYTKQEGILEFRQN